MTNPEDTFTVWKCPECWHQSFHPGGDQVCPNCSSDRYERIRVTPLASLDRLRAERDDLRETLEKYLRRHQDAERRVEHLEKALRFYAGRKMDDGERARAALQATPEPECEHDWIDVRNEVVESGEMCRKCGAIRATPEPTEEER